MKKSLVVPLDVILLRTPLHSLTTVERLYEADNAKSLTTWLHTFYSQSENTQAIYLASPSLYKDLVAWLTDPTCSLSEAQESALVKYAIRSSTRSTPFGLFAGLCELQLADSTLIRFEKQRLKPITRLDSSALVHLYHGLLNDDSIRRSLRFKLNNSVYEINGQYRYSEFIDSAQGRNVLISSLEIDEYLKALVFYAAEYRHFFELVDFICQLALVTQQEANEYIETLINEKFLLSELEPNVTGKPYTDRLKDYLGSLTSPNHVAVEILQQTTAYQQIVPLAHLQAVDHWLQNNTSEAEHSQSYWQANLWYNLEKAELSRRAVQRIGELLVETKGFWEGIQPSWVNSFKEQFYRRYENRPVPLLLVLDNESGIGLGSALQFLAAPSPLADTVLGILQEERKPASPVDDGYAFRQTLLHRMTLNGDLDIELTSNDLPESSESPSLYGTLGSILASSSADVDAGNFSFAVQMVTANPTALAGRFCQDSSNLTQTVAGLHAQEQAQRSDSVYAEIVHLAGARSGNVNVRPTLRAYEIPYITPPSVDDEHVISLSDLLVSVPNGKEIKLYSKRLKKWVIPKLTTAHNTQHGDEVYQFLSGISLQSGQLSHWSWRHFHYEPVLPRLRYKQLILSRAQWTFSQESFPANTPLQQAWNVFKDKYKVPRFVVVAVTDNELMLDTHSSIGQRLLFDQFRKHKRVKLIEWVSADSNGWIADLEGEPFAHEVLLSFSHLNQQREVSNYHTPGQRNQEPAEAALTSTLQRTFQPGSEWLYCKLYLGPQTADLVLAEVVGPLLESFIKNNLVRQWHFVRYNDPEFHIRLRMQCDQDHISWQVAQAIHETCEPYLRKKYYYRLQFDTYEREIERYGESTIQLCEYYFYYDSEMMLAFLQTEPLSEESQKLQFALQNAIALVTDFGLSLAETLAFFQQRQRDYQAEFGGSKSLRAALNRLFRQHSAQLEGWLTRSENTTFSEMAPYDHLLIQRSERTKALISQLKKQYPHDETQFHSQIVASLLHMSLDRLFISQLRLYELITYHFLCRHYESMVARFKAK